jgi:hypothetical protein
MEIFVRTEAGILYRLKPNQAGILVATRPGNPGEFQKVVAIYPDRYPFLMAAIRQEKTFDGYIEGFNEYGTRVYRLEPTQVCKGMLLANSSGFKSEVITHIGEEAYA